VVECFFWYRPTRVVPDKRPLNGCVYVCVCVCKPRLFVAYVTATYGRKALRLSSSRVRYEIGIHAYEKITKLEHTNSVKRRDAAAAVERRSREQRAPKARALQRGWSACPYEGRLHLGRLKCTIEICIPPTTRNFPF